MIVFRGCRVLVAIYTVYAIGRGEVFAKSGSSGKSISIIDSPTYFWAVITVYVFLSIALLSVF